MKRRAFSGPDDLHRLQEFTSRCIRAHGRAGLLHPGDIAHHIYNGLRREDPTELVHLWEDENGVIRAWTLLDPGNAGLDPQVDPETRQSHPDLDREVNVWSERALLDLLAQRSSDAELIETYVDEPDSARAELLTSLGWTATDKQILWLARRDLAEVTESRLPPGYRIRVVRGVEEAGAVSELHAAGFGSSWTPELYARVMTSPGYSADREFLVESPAGELAAFCVVWPDVENRVGLFEPVAVHPDHRRLGLGRAVMRAGMAAMRTWGMIQAEILYVEENAGSGSLYRSEGFVPTYRVILFEKPRGQ